jgi:hypothetical protein
MIATTRIGTTIIIDTIGIIDIAEDISELLIICPKDKMASKRHKRRKKLGTSFVPFVLRCGLKSLDFQYRKSVIKVATN